MRIQDLNPLTWSRRRIDANRERLFFERLGDSRLSIEELEARLLQEAATLSTLYRCETDCGFDPERGNWLRLELRLSQSWSQERIPCILLIPQEFPAAGPEHFMLPKGVQTANGIELGSLFALTELIEAPTGWDAHRLPNIAWRKGDDLDRVIAPLLALITAVARLELTPPAEHHPLD